MRKLCLLFVLYMFSVTGISYAQASGSWELLEPVIRDEINFDSTKLQRFEKQYNAVLSEAQAELAGYSSIPKKHKYLFKKFHELFCEKYSVNVLLSDIFEKKLYNCLTATLIYSALARDCGLTVDCYKSDRHAFPAYSDGNDRYIVEVVNPESGFDLTGDIKDVINILVKQKIISQADLARDGYFNTYIKEVAKASKVPFDTLVYYEYYNQIVEFGKVENYEKSFEAALKFAKRCKSEDGYDGLEIGAELIDKKCKDTVTINYVVSSVYQLRDTSGLFKNVFTHIVGEAIRAFLQMENVEAVERIVAFTKPWVTTGSTYDEEDNGYHKMILAYYLIKSEIAQSQGKGTDAFYLSRLCYVNGERTVADRLQYRERSVSVIESYRLQHNYDTALIILDTLLRDIPNMPEGSVMKSDYYSYYEGNANNNLTIPELEAKISHYTDLLKKSPQDTIYKMMCVEMYRKAMMKAASTYDYDKAFALGKQALAEYPGNKPLTDDMDLVTQQKTATDKFAKEAHRYKKKNEVQNKSN